MRHTTFACLLAILTLMVSCTDYDTVSYETYPLSITLSSPIDGAAVPSVSVTLSTTQGNAWQSVTDAQGTAHFVLPVGDYSLSASGRMRVGDADYILGCSTSGIKVTDTSSADVTLVMTASRCGSLIIREVYSGGCQKDDGSGAYYYDKYVILYNNGEEPLRMGRICLAMASPYNAHAANGNYLADGTLSYATEGFIPAIQAFWQFPDSLFLQGGEQVVIALNGAVDHTTAYSNSVDLSQAGYYCTYDPLVFTNTTYYPVPSDRIPTSHYLTATFYGQGNAWPFSQLDPAFYIFVAPADVDLSEYASTQTNLWYNNGSATASNTCLRIPTDWIIDGVEIYTTTSTNNRKRLTDAIDAGAVFYTNQRGYSIHRCIDASATRAITRNAGLLVTGMTPTPDTSAGVIAADPSGIDAEASRRQGAIIIYQDTNNSSYDFFERYQASLRP